MISMRLSKPVGRQRIYENDAAKVAAYRARKNKKPATFDLAPELLERLNKFMLARDETKSQVVERALKDFFRKR
jgi:hypothetical protein